MGELRPSQPQELFEHQACVRRGYRDHQDGGLGPGLRGPGVPGFIAFEIHDGRLLDQDPPTLKRRSNAATAVRMSSNVGASPKNIDSRIAS